MAEINLFWKLDNEKNVVPASPDEAEKILRDIDKKKVKQENIGDKFVSTVFLVCDHGFPINSLEDDEHYRPVVFETMVFDNKENSSDVYGRYYTWDEAVLGHERIVKKLKEKMDDSDD